MQCYMWDSLEKFVLLQKLKEALASLKLEEPDDLATDRHHLLTTLNALMTDSSDWLVLDTQYIPVTANLPPDALKPLVSTPWTQPQSPSPKKDVSSPATEDSTPQQAQHATPKAKKPSTRGKKKSLEEPNAADTPSKVVAPSPSPRKTTGPKYSTPSLVVLHNVITSAFALPHEFPVYSLEGCLHWLTSDKTTPLDPGYVYAKWIEATKEGAKEEGQLVKAIDELVRAKLEAVDRILIGKLESFLFQCFKYTDLFVHKHSAIREQHNIPTYRTLDKFTLGHKLNYAHPMISRLAFIHQYEWRSQCQSIQKERTVPRGVCTSNS